MTMERNTSPRRHRHLQPAADGKAFEVEFTTLDGKTAAVATVEAAAARPVTGHEITHSRELTRAS